MQRQEFCGHVSFRGMSVLGQVHHMMKYITELVHCSLYRIELDISVKGLYNYQLRLQLYPQLEYLTFMS